MNSLSKRLVIAVLLLSGLAACGKRSDGKKTRLRPEVRRLDKPNKDKAGDDKAGKASADVEDGELDVVTSDCTLLTTRESDNGKKLHACDVVNVKVAENGDISLNATHKIENVANGYEVKASEITRYSKGDARPTADENGNFISARIKFDAENSKINDKSVLYLTYILPYKTSDIKKESLSVYINGQKLKEKDLATDLWTEKRIVHIKNYRAIKNINFEVDIRAELENLEAVPLATTEETEQPTVEVTTTTTAETTATTETAADPGADSAADAQSILDQKAQR